MLPENDALWLQVIGKSLAYLCMQHISQNDPKRVPDMVSKVKFLEGLGVPIADAAQLLGTTANSVKTNLRQREKTKGGHRWQKSQKMTHSDSIQWRRSLGS